MKREHLLAVVEKAVERTMKDMLQSHPETPQGDLARSIEKRLSGMLGSKSLLAMGHKPGTKLRGAWRGVQNVQSSALPAAPA